MILNKGSNEVITVIVARLHPQRQVDARRLARIRQQMRLELVGEELVGIVTLDDIAVRSGNLEVAQKMTQDVIEGALPQFYFHERG